MKLVIIGLDGVEPGRLLGDARLAHLRALAEEGVLGRLGALHEDGINSRWRSVVSGREAGAIDPASGRSDEWVWDVLGEGAGRVEPILVNVPMDRSPGRSRTGIPEIDITSSDPGSRTRARFLALRREMEARPWEFAMIVEEPPIGLESDGDEVADRWSVTLDEELGRTLDTLLEVAGELSVLIVAIDRTATVEGGAAARPTSCGAIVLNSSRGLPAGTIEDVRLIDLAPTLLTLAGRPVPEGMTGRALPIDRLVPRIVEDEDAVIERLRGLGYLA